jgi:hypothetical protein
MEIAAASSSACNSNHIDHTWKTTDATLTENSSVVSVVAAAAVAAAAGYRDSDLLLHSPICPGRS